ncbi:MAG: pyocin activator PrtN family protein [Pseudorhodoplanes sp.]|nr:pyocin activator PrtN family protein [Pseudorhodoplanes sp.]
MSLNTAFLLMAQYGGKAIIPVKDVCRDYFSHLTPTMMLRKIGAGEIALPLVRVDDSQKSAKGVHLQDLADYLDRRRTAAVKECLQLQGGSYEVSSRDRLQAVGALQRRSSC